MWNKHSPYIMLVLSSVFVISCGEQKGDSMNDTSENTENSMLDYRANELTPTEYVHWYKNEGSHLRKMAIEENLQFTLEFRPSVYSAIQEIQKEEISKAELDSTVSHYEGLMQFRLEIEIPGSNEEFFKQDSPDSTSYEERVKYYAFGMQKDISLIIANDTIPCAMFHFERNYGASPKSVFLMGFVNSEISDKAEVIINEKVFTRKKIKFSFTKEELTNLPLLKTL